MVLGGHGWRLAASMAAHVAATPAGVQVTRLATGISLGAAVVGRMSESSWRVGAGWDGMWVGWWLTLAIWESRAGRCPGSSLVQRGPF